MLLLCTVVADRNFLGSKVLLKILRKHHKILRKHNLNMEKPFPQIENFPKFLGFPTFLGVAGMKYVWGSYQNALYRFYSGIFTSLQR